MAVLSELEPNKVFKYFEEICSIPHGSNNLKQISDYLVDFAKAHNLKYRQDDDLNVIIWKDGSKGYEDSEPVILHDALLYAILIYIFKHLDALFLSNEIGRAHV